MGDDARPAFGARGLDALHAVDEGGPCAAADSAETVTAGRPNGAGAAPKRQPRESRSVKLTLRETECLGWAAQGKSEWEISQILGISEHTAEKHLINARVKLGAVNRVHAVATAIRQGLIL